ncbi:MAG: aryl-alcohol dehydrogenase-like predicted oxidoreductase [Polaribacter sp.]|jgi:aryl-alcohol dehydrogenase-like predicted oxidoreductase
MTDKLILGTVQFGLNYGINNKLGQISENHIKEILDVAFDKGIKILDTAEGYGNAQERIGNYHKNTINKFDIVTKFHAKFVVDENFSIRKVILNDLSILSVDVLYGYMFHSFSDYKKYYTLFEKELLILKKEGVINKIGVSVYTNEELLAVIENKNIELIQLPFNLLDNHKLRSAAILEAKEKGIEIHTRSAFLQGLFFKSIDSIQGNIINLKNNLKKINNQINTSNSDTATFALNYPVGKNYVDKVLIGVDSLEQLEQNINAVNTSLNFRPFFESVDSLEVKNKELLNPSLWKI